MKFLCVTCDEPMQLNEARPPDEVGSITAVYGCTSCGQQTALLTNPWETEVVQSLGVKIGGTDEAGEAEGCPFSGVIAGMERDESDRVVWTEEARARLERIPEFVRPMAREGIERYAASEGLTTIDVELLEEARGRFGM